MDQGKNFQEKDLMSAWEVIEDFGVIDCGLAVERVDR